MILIITSITTKNFKETKVKDNPKIEQKFRCPCGESYFTIKSFHDSNGPFEEHWEMKCGRCKQGYQLSSVLGETKRGPSEMYLWAPRNIHADLGLAESNLKKAQKEVLNIAHEMYLEQWILYCFKGKNKREIWNRMTSNGQKEPQFALFENLLLSLDFAEVLTNYFNYQNMDYIFDKLDITNEVLDEMKKLVMRRQRAVDRIKNMLWINGVNNPLRLDGLNLNGIKKDRKYRQRI